MKSIIIVSKCLRVIKFKSQIFYEFSFKGVCSGSLIKKIKVQGLDHHDMVPGHDYIVQVRELRIIGTTLEGKIVKFKMLEDCFDRS
jgi:hypothetical protein